MFALALICGIGSLETTRIEFSTAVPEGMLLFTLLLPVSAAAIPRREGSGVTKPIAVLSVFAVAFSIVVVGTLSLPVALTRKDAFFEFAKSLGLFGTVQRFESLVAVAVTISVFSMLSLLYSGIGTMAEYTHPGSRKPVVILCAGTSAAIVAAKLWLSPKLLALLSLLIWGILSVLCQTVATHKSLKKGENTS